jgi:hypothetical protein
MRLPGFVLLGAVIVLLLGAMPAFASPPIARSSPLPRALDAMMVALAPESARSGATIRALYQNHLDLLMLDEYSEITGALDNGGLVPLPDDPARFNLAPRLDGPHPIGEKDLDNQRSYLAARPATIGALLDVASRVHSGPLEITSLVRHGDYQDALRVTNANATTAVPMHTMGLAFDIALLNTPLETVHEIRDVLQRMQVDGDILFVGERHQLVFHVVPHPSRLGHYTDFYMQAVGAPPTGRSAHVVALSGRDMRGPLTPTVTTEVLTLVQADGARQTLWTDADGPLDEPAVAMVPEPAISSSRERSRERAVSGFAPWFVLLLGLAATTWRVASPRRTPGVARLFP